MTVQSRQLKARIALSWLDKAGCLDRLLTGENLKANDETHIGGLRGRSLARAVRDNINDILTQYNGGLSKINAANIDFNRGIVCIKPEYSEQFAQAIETYRSVDNGR